MALTQPKICDFGSKAHDFKLEGVDGKTYTLADVRGANGTLVTFICNHCPYVRACEDRFIALQKDYAAKGVRLVAINSNDASTYPDDSFANMKLRAKEKNYPFPYLCDETQKVARAYDAACTPDIFLFDAQRKLVYNGRLDDNWQEPTKVTKNELNEVIDCTLAGKALPFEAKPSMGCNIKWKNG